MKNAIVSLFLDTRYETKSKEYPIKLRIYFQTKTKYYGIKDHSATESEFKKITGDKPREEYRKIKNDLNKAIQDAEEIIDKLPYFTFEQFEKQYLNGQNKLDKNLFTWIDNKVKKLEGEERLKTAELYELSGTSFKKYTGKKDLNFYDITVDFLNKYEKWFLEVEQNSITTLGIYLRNIRAMFNEAIEAKVILADCYPFGYRRFEIPASKNTKKALPISDIGKLFKASSTGSDYEKRWKAMWFFIYLCNGLNTKDVCMLKYNNLIGDKIVLIREKTKVTKRKSVQRIEIIITKEIRAIIDKWGVKPTEGDKYIFPILTPDMSPQQKKQTIHQTIKKINKYIRRIAKSAGIKQDIKTMEARHSFATVLKNSGASIEFISESMGHGSIKTTQDYLGSFEDDKKKEFAEKLLDFGNTKPNRRARK